MLNGGIKAYWKALMMEWSDKLVLSSLDALTLRERVSLYRAIDVHVQDEKLYETWTETRSLVTRQAVAEFFRKDGYTESDIKLALQELDEAHIEYAKLEIGNQSHIKDILRIFQEYYEVSKQIKLDYCNLDFSVCVMPYIVQFEKGLEAVLDSLENITVSEDATRSLLVDFVSDLLGMAIKTLLWEQHNYGKMNPHLHSSKDLNLSFTKEKLLEFEDVVSFYTKYPVIARRITTRSIHLIRHYAELIGRLDKDYPVLTSKLGLKGNSSKVENFLCNKGDTHCNARSVIIVQFESQKIVYKPKGIRVQEAYYCLTDKLFSHEAIDDHLRVNTYYGKTYAFQEFIEQKECEYEFQIEKYYKRFGQLCALIYILSGKDIHYENLIAHSEYPVVIDVETLFQSTPLSFWEKKPNAIIMAESERLSSVADTYLIPSVTFGQSHRGKGIDVSALSGDEQIFPNKVLVLKSDNTVALRFEPENIKVAPSNNLPFLNEHRVDASKYANYIIDAFVKTLEFIESNKEFVTANLIVFENHQIRHILKSTYTYKRLLDFSSHPNYAKNMLKLERMFMNIISYNKHNINISKYEIEDMIGGDIPFFSTSACSKDLYTSSEKKISNFFVSSTYDAVVQKIMCLTHDLIYKQAEHLTLSLGVFSDTIEKKRGERLKACAHMLDNHTDLLGKCREEAIRIANRMLQTAIVDNSTSTMAWVSYHFDADNARWSIEETDSSIQDGLLGPLAFFSELSQLGLSNSIKNYKNIIFNTIKLLNKSKALEVKDLLCYFLLVRKYFGHDGFDELKRISEEFMRNYAITKKLEPNASLSDWALAMYSVSRETGEKCYQDNAFVLLEDAIERLSLSEGGDKSSQYEKAVLYNALKKMRDEKSYLVEVPARTRAIFENALESLEKDLDVMRSCLTDMLSDNRVNLIALYEPITICIDDANLEQVLEHIEKNISSWDTVANGSAGYLLLLIRLWKKSPKKNIKNMMDNIVRKMLYEREANGTFDYYVLKSYENIGFAFGLSGIGFSLLSYYALFER